MFPLSVHFFGRVEKIAVSQGNKNMGQNCDASQAPTSAARSRNAVEGAALSELLRSTFGHLGYAILGNLVAAISLTVGAWSTVSRALLLAWLGAMFIFNGLRWLQAQHLPVGAMSNSVRRRWDRMYLASAFTSGALWGLAGWFFFVPGESGHNFFVALYVISMSAAAATSLSYHRVAYVAFCLPAVVPVMLRLVQEDGTPERAVSFVIPLYFLFMILLSRHIYKAAYGSIVGRIAESHLAYHDYLTGVANRRYFEEGLNREWSRTRRSRSPLSLVILDIDNFKRFNDVYGHAIGDDVLRSVSRMIAERVRGGSDIVARVGGEEFAVLLPETDSEGASNLAEELCRRARNLQTRADLGCPSSTLSAGVATCIPDMDMTPERLTTLADLALYRAKAQGKDRVEISSV